MGYRTPPLQDDSKMPYGKYKGVKMADIPAHYLLWIYDNNKCDTVVSVYIHDNLDVLRKEVSESK